MYIDEAYLQNAFGSAQVAALCPSAGELSTTIELAEAAIEGALTSAGYTTAVPSSVYTDTANVPKAIKLATYGAWLVHAHGRHGIEVPTDYRLFVTHFDRLQNGKLEIPGLPKNTTRAVDGIVTTSTDDVPPVFSRTRMAGF